MLSDGPLNNALHLPKNNSTILFPQLSDLGGKVFKRGILDSFYILLKFL